MSKKVDKVEAKAVALHGEIVERFGEWDDSWAIDGVDYFGATVKEVKAAYCIKCGHVYPASYDKMYRTIEAHPNNCPAHEKNKQAIMNYVATENERYFDGTSLKETKALSVDPVASEYLDKFKNFEKNKANLYSSLQKSQKFDYVGYSLFAFTLLGIALGLYIFTGVHFLLALGAALFFGLAPFGFSPVVLIIFLIKERIVGENNNIDLSMDFDEYYGYKWNPSNKENKEFYTQEEGSLTLGLESLTGEQRKQVVEELKAAQMERDSEKFAKIISNVKNLEAQSIQEMHERMAEEERREKERMREIKEKNPALQDIPKTPKKLRGIDVKKSVKETFSQGDKDLLEELNRQFNKLTNGEENLPFFDKEKLRNCLGQFTDAVKIINGLSDGADEEEMAAYGVAFMELARNCNTILSTIKPSLIEGNLAKLSSSANYLQDKYMPEGQDVERA